MTKQLVLTVGYDRENLEKYYRVRNIGEISTDLWTLYTKACTWNGKSETLSSSTKFMTAATELFERIINPDLLVRRLYLTATHVIDESLVPEEEHFEQMELFTDYDAIERQKEKDAADQEREKRWQKAVLDIKKKYGKNAILRGMNFEDGTTARERNGQIGGHKA